MNKWNKVIDYQSQIMPKEDCEVWVTRMSSAFNQIWVQKISYYKDNGCFDWDGVVAWMPNQEEKPVPYDCSYYYAGKPRKFKVVEV